MTVNNGGKQMDTDQELDMDMEAAAEQRHFDLIDRADEIRGFHDCSPEEYYADAELAYWDDDPSPYDGTYSEC